LKMAEGGDGGAKIGMQTRWKRGSELSGKSAQKQVAEPRTLGASSDANQDTKQHS
jgi:hypothetical protein